MPTAYSPSIPRWWRASRTLVRRRDMLSQGLTGAIAAELRPRAAPTAQVPQRGPEAFVSSLDGERIATEGLREALIPKEGPKVITEFNVIYNYLNSIWVLSTEREDRRVSTRARMPSVGAIWEPATGRQLAFWGSCSTRS